jgi:gluconokinase
MKARADTPLAVSRDTAIIVMGVSGVGKSTFAVQLARQLNMAFIEGDTLHPASNVQKMTAGTALSDEDRWPWLDAVAAAVSAARPPNGVVATCSSLKRIYRDRLRGKVAPPLLFVCLTADRATLVERLRSRQRHFMPEALLDSQLSTLEMPDADENAWVICAAQSLPEMLRTLRVRQPN